MNKRVLEVTHATMRFGGLVAVNDLSMHIDSQEIVALIGPNGAGKTTAFNMITGVYTPTEGSVILQGRSITGMRPDRIAAAGIARTFQNIRLFKALTVLDNVLIAQHVRLTASWLGAVLRSPRYRKEEARAYERAKELLTYMGLWEVRGEISSSLPYGMQRKLEIARALAARPRFILLDEPFAGVDPIAVIEIQRIVHFLKERGIGVLITDHNVRETLGICDHAYIISNGSVLAQGKPEAIVENPQVRNAYLGDNFTM